MAEYLFCQPAPTLGTLAAMTLRMARKKHLICAVLSAFVLLGVSQTQAFGQIMDIEILDTKGYRASKLMGSPVFNESEEKIGKVDDIILTREGMYILAAQIGPFIGVQTKIVLFPFTRIEIDEKNSKIVVMDASKDQLKKMAAFVYPQ